MPKYLPRIIDDTIEDYLEIMGAVLITGPKWCGKTTTAKQHAKSMIKLLSNKSDYYTQLIEINPEYLLNGEKPKLIDEWQITPPIWDTIRDEIDEADQKGLFILTGSTVVDESNIKHSGTGRIHRLLMMPMSLYESNDSTGDISLQSLFENPDLNINSYKSNLTFKDIAFLCCRGGWPEAVTIEDKEKQIKISEAYYEAICETDISTIDNIKRDADRARYILRAYARNISTLAKNTTILKDVIKEYEDIQKNSYYEYVDAFKRLFVIKDIKGWAPNIRSSNTMRKGSKRQFIDPSIATSALEISPEILMSDLKTFGFIFENLCIRDLTIYVNNIGGNVYYYNDSYGLETDCILRLKNGKYALIEFKLGSFEIDKGAENLLKLKKLIQDKRKEQKVNLPDPSFMAIITGTEFAYTRKDGVKVIPIGCLKN